MVSVCAKGMCLASASNNLFIGSKTMLLNYEKKKAQTNTCPPPHPLPPHTSNTFQATARCHLISVNDGLLIYFTILLAKVRESFISMFIIKW